MSGATTAMYIAAAAAVAGTAYSVYNGERTASEQKKAAATAEENARKQMEAQTKAQDEAANKASPKRAGAGGALDAAVQAGKGGASGTMLTGPTGVANSALSLGKSTLLGG